MQENSSQQQHHTFGKSLAALRLKEAIDKPDARYKSAVRILNIGETRVNDIMNSDIAEKKYFLQLIRDEVVRGVNGGTCDAIIKSLCRNVFSAKYRTCLKSLKD